MEFKAYLEGIERKWWLIVILIALGLFIGNNIGTSQASKYSETTSILVNAQLLANTIDPSKTVQLNLPQTPADYEGVINNPAVLNYINKHYPRLTKSDLTTNIVVTTNKVHEILFISVTDTSPASAADIANYLATQFVQTENTEVSRQLYYYQSFVQSQVTQLNNEINNLNLQIQQLEPPPGPVNKTPPISPAAQQTIYQDQALVHEDSRNLYKYQLSQESLQNTNSLFANAYIVMQPATGTGTPVSSPPSTNLFRLIGLGTGLIVAVILIIVAEFFSPFVRHRGELERLVGMPALAELPKIYDFEQNRLAQFQPPLFGWRFAPVRRTCAEIGAHGIREHGYTVLLTSPRQKRNFAPVLATQLAQNGMRTLLINADFQKPGSRQQTGPIKLIGPSDFVTNSGVLLSFIRKTANPHLFVLPANATVAQNVPMSSSILMDLLPEWRKIFSIIIIDAPTLDHADTHFLAKKVQETILLVKKRKDSLKTLKVARTLSLEELRLNVRALLLG